MKSKILSSFAFFAILIVTLFAGPLPAAESYQGPILFHGSVVDGTFSGKSFTISVDKNDFLVTMKKSGVELRLDSTGLQISDAILSANEKVVVIQLQHHDFKDPTRFLVVLRPGVLPMKLEYRLNELSDKFGRIVEVADVLDSGDQLLAKCSRAIPEGDGSKRMEHSWVIAKLAGTRIEIDDTPDIFTKWGVLKLQK